MQSSKNYSLALFSLVAGMFVLCLQAVCSFCEFVFACLCWTDTLLMQGKGVMVKRAEKCPYCDSYFLKNSSDFQQHIWAHQGVIFLCLSHTLTHTRSTLIG